MIKLDAMENPWRLPPDLADEVGRIAAGAPEENDALLAALADILSLARVAAVS